MRRFRREVVFVLDRNRPVVELHEIVAGNCLVPAPVDRYTREQHVGSANRQAKAKNNNWGAVCAGFFPSRQGSFFEVHRHTLLLLLS